MYQGSVNGSVTIHKWWSMSSCIITTLFPEWQSFKGTSILRPTMEKMILAMRTIRINASSKSAGTKPTNYWDTSYKEKEDAQVGMKQKSKRVGNPVNLVKK